MTLIYTQMHGEAAGAARPSGRSLGTARPCAYCLAPFTPRRKWAKYCGTACRNEANARKVSTGVQGVVSSVRCLRRGGVSVTLRFTAIERDRALKLEPGKVVAVDSA